MVNGIGLISPNISQIYWIKVRFVVTDNLNSVCRFICSRFAPHTF